MIIFMSQEEQIPLSEIDLEAIRIREQEEAERKQRQMDRLSSEIAKLRDEAVSARAASGFEKQWREDEEYYEGVDDLNRATDQYMKPRSGDAGLASNSSKADENDCTEFLNVTRPFVDAAAARCGDILLPANDWNFSIRSTPVPEFDDHEDDERPMLVDQTGQPLATVADAIKARNKQAAQQTRKAETRIKDWLVQCGYKRESRKVLEGGALVGTGILKGPVPAKRTVRKMQNGALEIRREISPESKYISHWDFYPDMNCGENIQDGDYVFERDYLSARKIKELKDMPGYMPDAIDKVIKEGPKKRNLDSSKAKDTHDDERFEVWYCYKYIMPEDMDILDAEFSDECGCDEARDPIFAHIMMINDTVIHGVQSPLEDYGFPFDVFVWQRVAGKPFGIGVARQGRTAQKTVLAAFRTLMKNQGLASVPMLALMRSAIIPADGNWNIVRGKQWLIKEDSGVRSINEAIQTLVVPSMQADLAQLIQIGMKMMEDSTGVTFLMQGQQGAAPDTVGGMQMMLQSSSTVLRREARLYDENVTVPHINRYYGWLLMYGEDDEKGDLMIDATGSSSLAEREIQAMQLPQILAYAQDPAFELSKKKTLEELLRALHFDPGKFDMDEDEKQALQNTQPQDPRLMTEQLRSQTALEIADKRAQVDMQRIQKDTDRDALYSQGVAQRNQMTYEAQIAELQLRKELALLEYANNNKMKLDEIKAKLASDSMKLAVQKELASVDTAPASQVINPPMEPVGRAPIGEAFQK